MCEREREREGNGDVLHLVVHEKVFRSSKGHE